MLTKSVVGFSMLFAILGAACAMSSTPAGEDEMTSEDQELSAASQRLAGTDAGSGMVRRLELTSAHRFVADVGTNAGRTRVEGTFSANSKSLTLRATAGTETVRNLFGRYSYTLDGSRLSLTRPGFRLELDTAGSNPCESAGFVCADAFVSQGQCPAGMTARAETCNPDARTIAEAICCAPTPVPPPPPPPQGTCRTDADCACDRACITPGGGLASQCTPRFPLFCASRSDCPAGMLCEQAGRASGVTCSFKECLPQP